MSAAKTESYDDLIVFFGCDCKRNSATCPQSILAKQSFLELPWPEFKWSSDLEPLLVAPSPMERL